MKGKADVAVMSSKEQFVVPSATRIELPKFLQKELEKLESERKLNAAGFLYEADARRLVEEAVQQTRQVLQGNSSPNHETSPAKAGLKRRNKSAAFFNPFAETIAS